ncbi:MAG: mismatch repair protein MutS [Candidatus Binatota bacterium]|nr:mismatch repair protein MutS [Candidatus Binatota bacterium]
MTEAVAAVAERGPSGVKLTPMIQQYLDVKGRYPDAILLYRLGDFYEMFFEDAERASRLLELTLTSRNKGDEVPVPLCGVPHHSIAPYVQKLVQAGHKVAICEQVPDAHDDPLAAKGIVDRRVVRVVTPGTVLEEESLEPREPSYLVAIFADGERSGIGVADLTTGELRGMEIDGSVALREELSRLRPRELIYCEGDVAPDTTVLGGTIRVSARPASSFDAERLRSWHEATHGSAAAWIERPVAARALGGVLRYLEEQLVGLDHLRAPVADRADGVMVVDETTRRNLELVRTIRGEVRGSLLWALDETSTPMGARTLRRWLLYPLLEPAEIGRRLDAVEELLDGAVLRDDLAAALTGIGDLERIAGRIGAGTASPRDLVRLADALDRAADARDRLANAGAEALADAREEIAPLPELRSEIRRALVEDPPLSPRHGEVIRGGYSREVDELRGLRRDGKDWIAALETSERSRTGIASLKVRYNKVFGYYIEVTNTNLKLVPADYQRKQTIAGGERFVIPELKDYEARVLGAEERLRRLETDLFEELRARATRDLPRVTGTAAALGRVDAVRSLGEVAARGRWVRPEIVREPVLEVREGRHPVVECMLPAGRFVPNDVELDPDRAQIVILTGPNMAGKSTYLRQTALLVLLAQIGSFVPAARARIGIVDRIFTRVGASDDLAGGDSTFMVEMKETAHILRNLTARSLVVLDEIGRGTSTFDGISIAWAVAEHLHASPHRPKTLFATHYHELTEIVRSCERAVNHSVAVKEWKGEILFLRRIVPGPASQSYGIHVARLAGVPPPVIARSREILAALERGETVGATRPAPADGVRQLALFAAADETAARLVEELRTVEPLSLTPIEALAKLAELVEKARQGREQS